MLNLVEHFDARSSRSGVDDANEVQDHDRAQVVNERPG